MNNNTKDTSVTEYMARPEVQRNITNALGNRKMGFITSVASLVNNNKQLKECEHNTVLAACLIAASLDLPLNQNLGFAYIIPYNKTVTETVVDPQTGKEKQIKTTIKQAQFQMGWKGFVQLAQRTGQLEKIHATDIREGEIIEDDLVTGEMVIERAENRNKLPIAGYMAYIRLKNGFSKQFYMTKAELEAHAKRYSASYRSNSRSTNVWRDDFDSMAKKTVIKLLLSKYAPMTADLARAIEADQAVEDDNGLQYVDNEPVDPKQLAYEKEVERVRVHIEGSKSVEELEQCRDFVTDENEQLFSNKFDELTQKEEDKNEKDKEGKTVDVKADNDKPEKKVNGKGDAKPEEEPK